MKRKIPLYLLAILMLVLSACSGTAVADSTAQMGSTASDVTALATTSQAGDSAPVSADFDIDDFISTANGAITSITLNGDSIATAGEGVNVNGSIVTITAVGVYEITGTLNNGQIVVETEDKENVTLLLAGVNIYNENSAPIYVANAEKVIITLAEGTQNNVSDGASYTNLDESGEPNAAIFSHDDLTINGAGTLNVTASYNNGIASKDDLKITGGTITVTAVNDGIKGKDSVAVKDGLITINAGADGIQTTNTDKTEKGFVAIEGGTLNITSALDGIQAATSLSISGGDLTIDANSGKGINAGINLHITGGTFNIASADDSLHANANITIDDGVFQLASGDDGIRSEISLTINGGEVNVTRSLEGLESALITINDGYVHLITSDDGINATAEGSGEQADSSYVYINGGYILVDANGDGLDSNGNAMMTGGVLIVQGPTMQNNGSLDVNGEFEVNGGTLIVSGSSGMPGTPSTSSTQNAIGIVLDAAQPGGTLVHIESLAGDEILTYESTKEFQLFVFSSPALQMNTTYVVYVGGTSTGTITNGVYSDGTYTPGTQIASLEVTSNITTSGNFESGKRGGRP